MGLEFNLIVVFLIKRGVDELKKSVNHQQKKYNNAVKKNKTKKQLANQCSKCSFIFGDGRCSKHESWCYIVNKNCRDFKEKE